jgi:hypothetical protein
MDITHRLHCVSRSEIAVEADCCVRDFVDCFAMKLPRIEFRNHIDFFDILLKLEAWLNLEQRLPNPIQTYYRELL